MKIFNKFSLIFCFISGIILGNLNFNIDFFTSDLMASDKRPALDERHIKELLKVFDDDDDLYLDDETIETGKPKQVKKSNTVHDTTKKKSVKAATVVKKEPVKAATVVKKRPTKIIPIKNRLTTETTIGIKKATTKVTEIDFSSDEHFKLLSPVKITRFYNEALPNTEISWIPKGDYRLILSRYKNSGPAEYNWKLQGRSNFLLNNLVPGTWYGKLISRGTKMVKHFTIKVHNPKKLGLSISKPKGVKSIILNKNKRMISWRSTSDVAYYQLQISVKKDFKNVFHQVSTNRKRTSIANVPPGKYFVRLSGFNKRSGKWEYSSSENLRIKEI